jgi:hypothetical protein
VALRMVVPAALRMVATPTRRLAARRPSR